MKQLHILSSENTEHPQKLIKAAQAAAQGWLLANPAQQAAIMSALNQLAKSTESKKKNNF